MGTIRFFSGGRDKDYKTSPAQSIVRLELDKKGKLPPGERYKRILKKKLEESKKTALIAQQSRGGFKMSKKAEQALKEISMKKAAKEAKALRRMVIVQPRTFPNGRITQKGAIYDVAGNMVAKVNTKNGKMATMGGWVFGKYKPKSYFNNILIQESIDKYSPYYVNLRKLQAQQQGAQPDSWDSAHLVHGAKPTEKMNSYGYPAGGESMFTPYGSDISGPRQNIGATAWGAMSDNIWGTYTDNVWGKSLDNVWGRNSTDVWGGIGGNPFGGGGRSVQFWNTGSGKNYLKGITSFLVAFLGLKTKKSKDAFHQSVQKVRGQRAGRSAAPTARAPVRTGR